MTYSTRGSETWRAQRKSHGREKSKYKNILMSKNVPYMFAQEQKGGRGADKFLIL